MLRYAPYVSVYYVIQSQFNGSRAAQLPLLPTAAGLSKGQIDWRVHATLDFESRRTWPLTIQVCDDHARQPLCVTGVSTVSLLDVNEPPWMRDSAFSTVENRYAGDSIGNVMSFYSDDDDVFTWLSSGLAL